MIQQQQQRPYRRTLANVVLLLEKHGARIPSAAAYRALTRARPHPLAVPVGARLLDHTPDEFLLAQAHAGGHLLSQLSGELVDELRDHCTTILADVTPAYRTAADAARSLRRDLADAGFTVSGGDGNAVMQALPDTLRADWQGFRTTHAVTLAEIAAALRCLVQRKAVPGLCADDDPALLLTAPYRRDVGSWSRGRSCLWLRYAEALHITQPTARA